MELVPSLKFSHEAKPRYIVYGFFRLEINRIFILSIFFNNNNIFVIAVKVFRQLRLFDVKVAFKRYSDVFKNGPIILLRKQRNIQTKFSSRRCRTISN